MITDFDDFCLWVYVIVDTIYQPLAPLLKLRGPQPLSSNSEVIAMSLIGECRGWDQETVLLSQMQEHQDKFPHLPTQSRFNRRQRNLMFVTNLIRRPFSQNNQHMLKGGSFFDFPEVLRTADRLRRPNDNRNPGVITAGFRIMRDFVNDQCRS